ncbi:SufD family Fe-S cluster assembly protein [Novosphingobium sp.]|uniref:SufD family Fe-S cluster assembly protein n=1 Tax=Novosphingobium sp. TaxID=1874826 RepID=UPI002B483611|nr:SufD family Fe-S cluster assembly protein [Novosphingobium sp.]HKR92954.1 SufD family Fe-S cluster assembly protein [Novosphingobium sp.]
MNAELTFPTRKNEDFRYSDLEGLAAVWPIAHEDIVLQDGEERALQIVEDAAGPVARLLCVTLGANARFDLRVLAGGPVYGRVEISVLLAEGAEFTLGAAQLATGAETLEIVTEVTHAGGNATSHQIVRSVLAGHATGTYLGRIAVARGADGTDAEQSVRAMLLDRTATANARPELEIYADDVKAAHGCAVGELDAMGLFYLMSRGLPPAEAKRLMLQAFIAEAFTGAPGQEQLCETALRRLEQIL